MTWVHATKGRRGIRRLTDTSALPPGPVGLALDLKPGQIHCVSRFRGPFLYSALAHCELIASWLRPPEAQGTSACSRLYDQVLGNR